MARSLPEGGHSLMGTSAAEPRSPRRGQPLPVAELALLHTLTTRAQARAGRSARAAEILDVAAPAERALLSCFRPSPRSLGFLLSRAEGIALGGRVLRRISSGGYSAWRCVALEAAQ